MVAPNTEKYLFERLQGAKNPVIYLRLFAQHDKRYGFGEANVLREGNDVTIVTYGLMVLFAMGVAQELAKAGVQCEVIDLRTLSPLDEATILESVEKTGRLVIVDEAYPRCSIAADISSMVAEKGFSSLKAPIAKVTAPHCPVPFAKGLEDAFVPAPERIGEAVMRTMHYQG